jgi:hypothetical protein
MKKAAPIPIALPFVCSSETLEVNHIALAARDA